MSVSQKILDKYEYLAFSGGGFFAGCFVGSRVALEYLTPGKIWKGFAGCSAGALMAFYCCLGLTTSEMYKLFKTQTESWVDNSALDVMNPKQLEKLRDSIIQNLIIAPLEKALGVQSISFENFKRATQKELCVVAHNLNEVKATYMSFRTHPRHDVVRAVQASMSIPFLFEPVKIDGSLMLDGGFSDNMPSKVFAKGKTLSLWIRADLQRKTTVELESSKLAYAQQILLSLLFSAENTLCPDGSKPREDTIVIKVCRGASFFPGQEDLQRLKMYIFQGCSATLQFTKTGNEACWDCFCRIYKL